MAEISKITLPNGENYDLKVYTNHIAPCESRTYESTDYYATAADQNESTWYFMSVRPDDWNVPWRVRFKLHTYCPDYLNCNSTTLSMITGRQNGIAYMNFNEITATGHYYISVYPLQKAGFDAGYSHAIGNSIFYASNYTNKNYYRTFKVDLIESQNCTVTLLDTPIKWSVWEGGNSTNYASLVNTNCSSRGLQETGDANDVNYQNRLYYSDHSIKAYSAGGRYTLTFTKNNNYILPITATDNSISGGAKVYTTESFDPFGQIYYRNSSAVIAADANVMNGTLYRQIFVDARYSFTGVTSSASTSVIQTNDPIYIACIIQEDGSAKLYQTPLATQIPLVENGLSYILLGFANNSYQFELLLNHPVYQFKNGQIIKLNSYVDGALIKNIPVNSSKTKSGNIVSFYDSKGNVPVDDLVVNIEPVQDLHGYDNPWPGGGGKNLYDASIITGQGSAGNKGIVCTVSNGVINLNGTATSNAYFSVSELHLPSGNYAISANNPIGTNGVRIALRDENGNYYSDSGLSQTNYKVLVSSRDINTVIIYVKQGTQLTNFKLQPQVEVGTAATSWSPYSNICPISGWDSVEVQRTGKNLLDPQILTSTNGNTYIMTLGYGTTGKISVKPNTTYTISIGKPTTASGDARVYGFNAEGTRSILATTFIRSTTFTTGADTVSLSFYCKVALFERIVDSEPMLELGSTATAYEPYHVDTYSVTFPTEAGTVYGGTMDVTTGELVVDRAIITLDGSDDESWAFMQFTPASSRAYIAAPGIDTSTADSGIADLISNVYKVSAYASQSVLPRITGRYNIEQINVFVSKTTREEFISSLVSEPLQVVYPLATPITYHLAPQEVTTLLGTNNIWADAGDTTVKYISTTNGVYIPEASNNEPGLMSIQDKAKVDSINNHVIASKTQPLNQQAGDIWLVISSSS